MNPLITTVDLAALSLESASVKTIMGQSFMLGKANYCPVTFNNHTYSCRFALEFGGHYKQNIWSFFFLNWMSVSHRQPSSCIWQHGAC